MNVYGLRIPRRLYLTNYATVCAQKVSKLPTSVLSKRCKLQLSLCVAALAADDGANQGSGRR